MIERIYAEEYEATCDLCGYVYEEIIPALSATEAMETLIAKGWISSPSKALCCPKCKEQREQEAQAHEDEMAGYSESEYENESESEQEQSNV